jgi:phytol kinase
VIANEYLAFLITIVIAVSWLRIIDFLAARGLFPSEISRKIIHIGTGPIFVLCWILFPDKPISRYLAAIIPLLITAQFFMVGMGFMKDEKAVKAMSRSGDRKEILRGPLIYGIVFIVMTILYWQDSPIGIIALLILCGGDGMADLVGSRFGKNKLPWSKNKSWQGSIGMFFGATILIAIVLIVFSLNGITFHQINTKWFSILIIIFITTIVESLPTGDLDNLFVPLTAIVLSYLLI